MLENQCALEIVDPEIVDPEIVNPELVDPEIVNPEIVNPEIVNPEIVSPEIMNLEIVNFGGEGAIPRRVEIDDTSNSLRKDLTEGFIWTQGSGKATSGVILTLRGDGVESGCNGGLLGNSGRKGGCNATQDAQDAQDAKTTSPTSGRSDDASDAGNIFADESNNHVVGGK